MARPKAISYDDKKWKRESDANALAEAAAIKADKQRLAGAKIAAKSMAEEQAVKAKAMKQVAKMPVKGKRKK